MVKIIVDVESIISTLAPAWALRRSRARALMRLYDASTQGNYHKKVRNGGFSGDAVMQQTGATLRSWARYLDENHDLAIGIMDALVNNIIGTGTVLEPMVSMNNGDLHERVNNDLRTLWAEFWNRPEVTRELPGNEVERILCRSWLRDGEVLTHHVTGTSAFITHPTDIPYSIELLEADYLPFDMIQNTNANAANIVHGVEKDAWGKPIAYHIFYEHPGNMVYPYTTSSMKTKRVSADDMTHLKLTKRLKQTRGVPIIHGIINRLDDIKDYEESERIAARVAAAFTGYIKRSADFSQDLAAASGDRSLEMSAGMIFDNLLPGEEVGTIGTDRPNTNLQEFRNSQLRACAAGTGTNYSSISKDYRGTYSAQRQEMVESSPAYERMRNFFIEVQMRPIYERFVTFATQRLVRIPSNVDMSTLYHVDMRGPGLPWIDPKKEVEADALLVNNGFASRHGIIRKRGGNPAMIDKQIAADAFVPLDATVQPGIPTSEQDAAQAAADAQAQAA